jgi:hypothetical protein
MKESNLEELRASNTLQDMQNRASPFWGSRSGSMLRHAQLGTWWERVLAILGAAILLLAVVVNVWRIP